jgi:hypothetical protein
MWLKHGQKWNGYVGTYNHLVDITWFNKCNWIYIYIYNGESGQYGGIYSDPQWWYSIPPRLPYYSHKKGPTWWETYGNRVPSLGVLIESTNNIGNMWTKWKNNGIGIISHWGSPYVLIQWFEAACNLQRIRFESARKQIRRKERHIPMILAKFV